MGKVGTREVSNKFEAGMVDLSNMPNGHMRSVA